MLFHFRVVPAFLMEGPMGSSYCNIIVSPLLHLSKVSDFQNMTFLSRLTD